MKKMDIQERGNKVLMNTYGPFPLCIERGEDVYMYDETVVITLALVVLGHHVLHYNFLGYTEKIGRAHV